MGKSRTGPKHVQSKFPPEKTSETVPDLDLSSILVLPEPVLESGIVDQNNFPSILEIISKLESIIQNDKKIISPNFPKLLSFCFNFLELQVQTTERSNPDPSLSLKPIPLQVKLRPREAIELKSR